MILQRRPGSIDAALLRIISSGRESLPSMRLIFGALLCLSLSAADRVERWGVFEIEIKGPAAGNPFVEVEIGAQFRYGFGKRVVDVDGFYDGNGVYRIRFMPD